ncbi:PAAR-like protein [Paraburkholderia caffeinilytica]|uniref:PAAR-like protein n=1 Tax=Paraburkholderia caffeinilytica TaxID=1761016 RepID=UPI003DA18D31
MSASDLGGYVVLNALMYCTAGSVPNQFSVWSRNVRIGENRKGNINDRASAVNIHSFMFCRIRGGRCIPQPTGWQKYDPLTRISGVHALIVEFEMRSAVSSIMKFETSGQTLLSSQDEPALRP